MGSWRPGAQSGWPAGLVTVPPSPPRAGAQRSAGQPRPLCHGALYSADAGRALGQSC